MSDRLTRLGLHFDDLNKLSIVDPDVAAKSQELREESTEFLDNITRFQEVVDGFISVVDSLAQEVEKEKMKAVGTRNLIQSMAKQREAKEQQYHALIIEKSTELERLRIQHQALLRTEAEQQDIIDQMVLR
ncbi:intraflagellar transport protein 20 homolog [Homalodisca vitripennis]|uniref:Intraflagellar transport 20 n=2 Tax=Proconiini TaxID=565685 RepID=A0A1B6HD15_9HEMI|nr:intraflagellar transport protein 20 homolog [Homalodisca vitripennis]XP_046681063.1 intraflagellar transport protein 20 homolog [Homalodisca vitripennis]XP_046681064.1 intraflagellar transport protein 20 homolog [Homalodisca vitripennis]KAG8309936.1 Intraflagellar transport protein 20 [Homalodisca vitripennis]KAG8309937.1 Intraflagellar transport protein 20 [Homalodisca vitripennis]